MRIVVCGGRDYHEKECVFETLSNMHNEKRIKIIAHGDASGADRLAGLWALKNNVTCVTFRANWTTHGKRAGVLRSLQMLKEFRPNVLVAFPGGKGTAHTIRLARQKRIKCVIVEDTRKACELPKQKGDDKFVGESKVTWGMIFRRQQGDSYAKVFDGK